MSVEQKPTTDAYREGWHRIWGKQSLCIRCGEPTDAPYVVLCWQCYCDEDEEARYDAA
jgi:hypothetical protein